MMKRCLIVVLCLLLTGCALAEEAVQKLIEASGVEKLNGFAAEFGGISAKETVDFALDGEIPALQSLISYAKDVLREPLKPALACLRSMALPVMMLAFMGVMRPKGTGGAALICRLWLYESGIALAAQVMDAARACLETTLKFSDVASPVLTAFLTAGGFHTSSALISPSAALAGNMVERLFLHAGMPVCLMVVCAAIAGNLGHGPKLHGLSRIFRRSLNWCAGLAVTLFTTLIFLKGNAAGISDNLAVRTAKYAVDSASSVIGSGVSDAWDTYLAGLAVARNAVGFTGVAVLLSVCLRPMAEMAAGMLCFSAVSAVLEFCGDGDSADAMSQLSGACQMALTLCGGAMAIWVILIGSTMSLGRGLI